MSSQLKRMRVMISTLAVLAALALGGSAIAGATDGGSSSAQPSHENAKVESDDDAAAQAAACKAAGIDPNADNVEYDDEADTCKLDSGGNDD